MVFLLAACAAQDPQESPGFWERETFLGDVREPLQDRGVSITLAFTGEVISNVRGGLERDVGADLLLDWVIDVDFEKAAGWPGCTARINPLWIAGDGIAGDVGDLTLVSNITGQGELRLFEAWVQQSFAKVFSLRAGILAADQEFILTASGMLYYNSVFGGPVFLTPNLAWPIYPVGAPGARARVDLGEGLYVQGAVYDGDPGTEDFNQSGLRIRLSDSDGLFTIVEGGWTTGDELPTTIKVGHFHHTAEFVEHSSGDPVAGLRGGYVVAEQRIWKGEAGSLDAFARVGYAEEDRSVVSLGIDAGVNFTGLIPGRPDDVLGFGVVYARISRSFADSQPDPRRWGHETVFELTYKIAITPWWSLQPDVQYVLHPGGSTSTRDAVVIGGRVDLLF